jgi:hypothetical protein
MSGLRAGWVLPALIVLALALLAFVVYTVAGFGDEGDEQVVGEGRDDARERALEEKRRKLKQVLASKRPPRRVDERRPHAPGRPPPDADEPASLTPRQRVALKSALDSFYSPADLADALRDRTAPEYAREVNRKYQELVLSETIGDAQGSIPVTPDVRQAINRLNLVAGYSMNMLHTMRPEGMEHLQQEMMDRINNSFGKRFAQLNQDYPFLNVQTVDGL